MQIFKMNFYVGFPRIKILAAPLSGPLRIFTHATPIAVPISLASVSTCLCPSKNLICNLDYVLSCTLHCTLLRE